MLRNFPVFLVLVSAVTAFGCAGAPTSAFVQEVDESTGESFTRAREPLRMSALRPALSRVGRDYLFVAPVSVSGTGPPQNYIWFAFGSSVDRHLTGAPLPEVNTIVLVVDDMPMTFDLVQWSEIASSEPFSVGVEHYMSYSARVTQSQLRRIASATELSAYVTNADYRSPAYELVSGDHLSWSDF